MKTKRTGKLQSQQQQCPPLPSLLSSSSSSSCSSTCQCLSIEQQAQYKECVPLQKKKSSGKAINLLSFSSSSSSSLPKIPSSSSDINEPENERGRHAKSKEEKDDDDEEDDEDEEKEDEYNEEEEEEEKSVQLSDLGPSCDSPSEPVSQESQDAQQVEYIVPEQTSPTFGEILRSGTLLEISYSICVIIPLGIALKIDGNNECVGTAPPVKEWAYVQLSLQFVILLINMIVLFIITRLDYRSRNKKLYTVMLGISRSFLAPWIVWILIGSAYFNKLKEAQCKSEIPYIYTMSQFIIIAAFVLVGLLFVALILCCGFFICRIGFLAFLFGNDANVFGEHTSDDNSDSISKEALESLPVVEFKDSNISTEDANCGICLCSYESNDLIKLLPCGHHFHSDCIDQWLSVNKTCPYCKQPADKLATPEKITGPKTEEVESVNV